MIIIYRHSLVTHSEYEVRSHREVHYVVIRGEEDEEEGGREEEEEGGREEEEGGREEEEEGGREEEEGGREEEEQEDDYRVEYQNGSEPEDWDNEN